MCDSSWSDVRSKRARGARYGTCCIVVKGKCWRYFREPDVCSWMVSYARLVRSIIVNHSQSMKRKRFGCTDTFNLWRDVKWTGLSSASHSFSDFFVSLIKLRSRLIFRDGNSRETFIVKAPKIQRLITPSLLQRKRYFKAQQNCRSKQLCITPLC